jgi:2-(1,2-epoxy-1,2-dihydrophenyl)acetyl-CoA isomerase
MTSFALKWWRRGRRKLAKGPTGAYAALKQALRGAFDQPLEAQLAVEARLQGRCGASGGLSVRAWRRFWRKRAPRFTGA